MGCYGPDQCAPNPNLLVRLPETFPVVTVYSVPETFLELPHFLIFNGKVGEVLEAGTSWTGWGPGFFIMAVFFEIFLVLPLGE